MLLAFVGVLRYAAARCPHLQYGFRGVNDAGSGDGLDPGIPGWQPSVRCAGRNLIDYGSYWTFITRPQQAGR